MVFLFVCTCTISFKRLLHEGFIQFRVTEDPYWPSLLTLNDIKLHSSIFLLQKAGHFSGFFILTLILTDLSRRKGGAAWATGYAILTEILQLFFYRDGRIVDMFVDAAGIGLAYALGALYRRRQSTLPASPFPSRSE
jgi:VanZ family protein